MLEDRHDVDSHGDEWVGLAGYFNRGGEMDLPVLMPWAIVAIAVKTLNGVVHCRGKQWSRDKYDNYGHRHRRAQRGVRHPSDRTDPSRILRDCLAAL